MGLIWELHAPGDGLLDKPNFKNQRILNKAKRNTKLNRPFPSPLVPLFQNDSKCETFHMKMSSACSFILMQIKVIIRMVSHLDSL